MKIYFDESGQSGCVLQREDLLNFREQPTFAIGALVVKNEKNAKKILQKYHEFKQKFNITEEIKGTDLLTKKYNDELNYFLNNIVDSSHYYVLIYDKNFYISTLLLISLLAVAIKLLMHNQLDYNFGSQLQSLFIHHFFISLFSLLNTLQSPIN